LLDMFWALKGATRTPRRRSEAHIAVAVRLLPAHEDVPATISVFIRRSLHDRSRPSGCPGRLRARSVGSPLDPSTTFG